MGLKNSLETDLRDLTDKIKLIFKNNKYTILVIVPICLVILLLDTFSDISDLFFKEEVKARGELLKMIGATIGGIVLLWGLWINNRRVKEQTRQNEISEKAQINTRFKDASTLLGSADTSSRLAGVYALHQIAIEIHKDADQEGFVKVIHDVLCSFIRENFKLKELETEAKGLNTTPQYEPIITPTIILQTTIDVLFSNKGDIYAGFRSDLSNCNIEDVIFMDATLSKVNFSKAILSGVSFFGTTTLSGVNFWKATLSEVVFWGTTLLSDVSFSKATLSKVDFFNATLSKVKFIKSELSEVVFLTLNYQKLISRKLYLKMM